MFQHIIITPFSFRRPYFKKGLYPDPLKPSMLDKRFSLFEMVTLPSLLRQEKQDFTWIILVDKKLSDFYRKKLYQVTSEMKNVYLVDFTKEANQIEMSWLKPYILPQTQYLITTTLDADDAVYKGFIKYVFEYYKSLISNNKMPPIHFLACKNVFQWDFISTPKAPLGYLKPWSRQTTLTVSTGLTCCCKYPEFEFSMRGIRHNVVGLLFKNDERLKSHLDIQTEKRLHDFPKVIMEKAKKANVGWDGIMSMEKNFHEIDSDGIQCLVLNHNENIQLMRMFERTDFRRKFPEQDEGFPIGLNLELASDLIKKNSKNLSMLFKLIYRILFMGHHRVTTKGIKSRVKKRIYNMKRLIKGYFELE